MAIFIDTGIFVACRNKADKHHASSVALVEGVLKDEFGQCYTSDYVFDEAIVLAQVRTKNKALVRDIGTYILGFPCMQILFTHESIFRKAWDIHDHYADKPFSFTDCTIVAWCRHLGIKSIGTIDSHFDGLFDVHH